MTKKRKFVPPVEPPPKEESESEEEEEEEKDGEVEEEEEEDKTSNEDPESESSEEGEEQDESSRREALKGLLQPFTKDQLISILKDAAAKNSSMVSDLLKSAQSDPIHRKIFVHGLPWDTTNETLSATFRRYGKIEECDAVLNRSTGRCKGFGFVLFKSRAGARKALKDPHKKIGTRTASCQLASAGPSGGGGPTAELTPTGRKLFVANVKSMVSVDRFRDFFAKFGDIEEGPTGLDRATGKFRGFAIILYKLPEGLKNALKEPVKEFEGCKLMCSAFIEGRVRDKAGNLGSLADPTASAIGSGAAPIATLNIAASAGGIQNFPVGLLGGQPQMASVFLGQSSGMGVFNPLMDYHAAAVGPSAFPAARLGRGAANPIGMLGVHQDANSISSSVINAYGSQAPLQGFGAYQGPQIGQGSFHGSAAAAPAARGQSGFGSSGPSSSYFRP
ncbi:hypothetical protein SAY87_017937 [Trapa incisa]|uniref:RRM domain-containing protein n=1 Tax=Trapa incisa TaxID=236973 RepID=A0AAN7L387_9MYRT|nr:hypothetical protein SAY87_017937 [Trapa incisa]